MKNNELLIVYAYAKNIWSSFKLPEAEEDIKMMNKVWYDFLSEYDIEIILTAIRKHSTESDFCSISKIANLCDNIYRKINNLIIDEDEVFREIRNAIDYSNCKENFQKLSDFAKEIVGHQAYLAKWALEGNTALRETLLRKEIARTIEKKENERIISKNQTLVLENQTLLPKK